MEASPAIASTNPGRSSDAVAAASSQRHEISNLTPPDCSASRTPMAEAEQKTGSAALVDGSTSDFVQVLNRNVSPPQISEPKRLVFDNDLGKVSIDTALTRSASHEIVFPRSTSGYQNYVLPYLPGLANDFIPEHVAKTRNKNSSISKPSHRGRDSAIGLWDEPPCSGPPREGERGEPAQRVEAANGLSWLGQDIGISDSTSKTSQMNARTSPGGTSPDSRLPISRQGSHNTIDINRSAFPPAETTSRVAMIPRNPATQPPQRLLTMGGRWPQQPNDSLSTERYPAWQPISTYYKVPQQPHLSASSLHGGYSKPSVHFRELRQEGQHNHLLYPAWTGWSMSVENPYWSEGAAAMFCVPDVTVSDRQYQENGNSIEAQKKLALQSMHWHPEVGGAAATSYPSPRGGMDGVSYARNDHSDVMFHFRANLRTSRHELRDIYGHVVEFSSDQHGSRFIQNKLETASSDERARIFNEIQPDLIPLMTDVFGNYVVQKLFQHGSLAQKGQLTDAMKGKVVVLSRQPYGCRVVQKALDHVLHHQKASIVAELHGAVVDLIKDQNGNHVIQKAIEQCSGSMVEFVVTAMLGQMHHLSTHSYGCRIVQRCLEKPDLPAKSLILSELEGCIQTMIPDQYGNYVVQHVVSYHGGLCKERVLDHVRDHIHTLSRHKYASNVVEKCLDHSSDAYRQSILRALRSNSHLAENGILFAMAKDQYGNYVIQKLLDTLCDNDYHVFVDLLRPAIALIRRSNINNKQIPAIESKMNRFANNTRPIGPPEMPSIQPPHVDRPLAEHLRCAPATVSADPKEVRRTDLIRWYGISTLKDGRVIMSSDQQQGAMP